VTSAGLIPEIQSRSSDDPKARVGTWRVGMSEDELRRQIGPTQNYGDST
jgi:hypothetical protein